MAETRQVQPYNSEEANRQLRSALQEAIEQASQGGKRLVRLQQIVAAATVIMMLFNGVTAWLTYQQIVAVRASTELTRQQFNLSQRPWVAATDLRITNVEIGKKPRAVVRVMNKGLTPAKIRMQVFVFIQRALPTEFSYPNVPRTSTTILLPDSWASGSYDYQDEISEQTMAKLDSGELLLYAYGFSEYEDPRGNTYPPTRFCAFWDPKQKTQVFCTPHNTVE